MLRSILTAGVLCLGMLASIGCATAPINTLAHPDAAVVRVHTTSRDGNKGPLASGFLVSSDGMILTCLHLVDLHMPTYVTIPGNTVVQAKVVEQDPASDLVILKVPVDVNAHERPLPFIKLSEADIIPRTHIRVALSTGMIDGMFDHWESNGRDLALAIRLSPGEIGAPVVDDNGHVVGMVSGAVSGQRNESSAIPVWRLIRMMPKLAE